MSRTVLIVDDHAAFRERARALLQDDGFEVVGEAGDGDAAVEAAHRLRPQIVLLDVRLPGIDGFEVAERLAAAARPARGGADLQPRREHLPPPPAGQPGARVHRQGGALRRASLLAARMKLHRSAPLGLAALAAGVALGVGAERIGGPPQPEATGDLVAGLALLGGGTVAWVRRARGGCAGLMVLTGGAWFAGDLSDRAVVRPPRAARAPAAGLPQRASALARHRRPGRRRLRRRARPRDRALDVADGRPHGSGRGGGRGAVPGRRWRRAPRTRRGARGDVGHRRGARVRRDRPDHGRRRGHRGAVGLLRRGDGHRGRLDGGSAVGALDARGGDRPGDRSRRSPRAPGSTRGSGARARRSRAAGRLSRRRQRRMGR